MSDELFKVQKYPKTRKGLEKSKKAWKVMEFEEFKRLGTLLVVTGEFLWFIADS